MAKFRGVRSDESRRARGAGRAASGARGKKNAMSFVAIKARQRALRVEAGEAVMARDAARIQSIGVQPGRLEAARLELEGHAEQFARAAADMAFGVEPPAPLRRALADAAAAQPEDDANPIELIDCGGARDTGTAHLTLDSSSTVVSPGEHAPAEAPPAVRSGVLGKRSRRGDGGDADARAGAKAGEVDDEAAAAAAAAAPAMVLETPHSDGKTADAAAAAAEDAEAEEGAARGGVDSTNSPTASIAPLLQVGGVSSAGAGATRRPAVRAAAAVSRPTAPMAESHTT